MSILIEKDISERKAIPGIDFPLVLYDGYCNLCSGAVQFILKNEKRPDIYFLSLQSPKLKTYVPELNLTQVPDSVLLFENGNLFKESTAALKISGKLKFPYHICKYMIYIPRFLRDPVYRLIANNRYSWFGKKASCFIPAENWKSRFLD